MNSPPVVILSGMPGKMCRLLAQAVRNDPHFELARSAFTGPEITELLVDGLVLVLPHERERCLPGIRQLQKERVVLVADFSHPNAVNDNAKFYCRHDIPFVMGTTGGDRELLEHTVENSQISAVIAPNMAAQVVALQAAIGFMAENFPNAFAGFDLSVVESHQKNKIDPSGTAKSFIGPFRKLGVPFAAEQIKMIRDPDEQRRMGVKEEYLTGHGWHTYTFRLPDGTMEVGFTHNISGRNPYVAGAMKALTFTAEQAELGVRGSVFSMTDVLRAG